MKDQERLEQLIRARHACISIVTQEEDYALELVRGAAFEQGKSIKLWSMIGGVRDGLVSDTPPIPETEHPAAALYHLAYQSKEPGLIVTLDLGAHLSDKRTLRLCRELIRFCRDKATSLIMLDAAGTLPAEIAAAASHFDVSLPEEGDIDRIVRGTLRKHHEETRIEINLTKKDLKTIIRNLRGLTRTQIEQIIVDCVAEDRRFDAEDINTVLARKRQLLQHTGLLEFVETPVDLSSIGGLGNLKAWLKIRRDSLSDKAAEYGLVAPRGVMMLGVQGAGKSLCAKAIATAWQRPLLRMDVSALYDRYVGESERRLRDALRQAESMAPIVLWIDEIEKAFASAASQSTDGGLSQRMFGTLLTWMQEHTAPVFLVATANDIEALPPELLRKGRFDEIFFVDLPSRETRAQIFSIHLKKRGRDPSLFDLDELAQAAEGYSGAEIEQAIVAAMHQAFSSHSDLCTQTVLEAVRETHPLSETMAERVQALQAWAKDRCVPAE